MSKVPRALAGLVLLLHCAAASAVPQDEPAARLADALSSGRWSAAARSAYADLGLARTRAACGERVPAAFWEWLAETPRVREVVEWALAADPAPKVFVCLELLRAHDEAALERFPDLAVGFAFAWGAGDDDEPRRRWPSWTRGRSAIPSMCESFAWYVEHRRRLVLPVQDACWQLLAYTALNDVPLDERAWVLKRYQGRNLAELRDLFGEVPYVKSGLDGKAQTLSNMVEFGGVCTVNTQYQMAVLRTLGVPATFGGGPGHCWPCWIGGQGRKLEFDRVNALGNADGVLGEWGVGGHERESDLRLLARAVAHGRERLRDAELCAAAVESLGPSAPSSACAALASELASNPYALRAWLTAARSIGAQRASPKTASALLGRLTKTLSEYPRTTLRVLNAAIPEQESADFDERTAVAFLRACAAVAEHPELASDVRRTIIAFHARTGRAREAARMRLDVLREAQDDGAAVDSAGLVRTRALGGAGGGAFVDVDEGHARLVGLRYSTTVWAGHRVLASIQPLFSAGSRTIAGQVHGRPRGDVREVVTPPGTVLIGLEVKSGAMLDGFRLISATQRGARIDLEDLQFSDWAGGSGDGWGRLLGGRAEAVVGIHGRGGSMIDALGIVLERAR